MLGKLSKLTEDGCVRGWICVLGGFILCLSFSADFSYPNLNTYLTSYMRTNGNNPTLSYDDFVYLTTTKVVLQGATMPFIGHLSRVMGTRWSILLGCAIYRYCSVLRQ